MGYRPRTMSRGLNFENGPAKTAESPDPWCVGFVTRTESRQHLGREARDSLIALLRTSVTGDAGWCLEPCVRLALYDEAWICHEGHPLDHLKGPIIDSPAATEYACWLMGVGDRPPPLRPLDDANRSGGVYAWAFQHLNVHAIRDPRALQALFFLVERLRGIVYGEDAITSLSLAAAAGHQDALNLLLQVAGDRTDWRRPAALAALGTAYTAGRTMAREALAHVLDDRSDPHREKSVEAIAEAAVGQESAALIATRQVLDDPTDPHRSAAVVVLYWAARKGNPTAIELLTPIAANSADPLYFRAQQGLNFAVWLGNHAAADTFVRIVRDRTHGGRREAVRMLGVAAAGGYRPAVDLLLSIASDPNDPDRDEINWAWGDAARLARQESLDVLLEVGADTTDPNRRSAARLFEHAIARAASQHETQKPASFGPTQARSEPPAVPGQPALGREEPMAIPPAIGGITHFDRLSEAARRVLLLAQQEADRLKHSHIGTEHVLVGLVCETEDTAARVLVNLGVNLARVRSAVEFVVGQGAGDEGRHGNAIGLTPRAQMVVEMAVAAASDLGADEVCTEHLLLGLLREGEGIAAGVLGGWC